MWFQDPFQALVAQGVAISNDTLGGGNLLLYARRTPPLPNALRVIRPTKFEQFSLFRETAMTGVRSVAENSADQSSAAHRVSGIPP